MSLPPGPAVKRMVLRTPTKDSGTGLILDWGRNFRTFFRTESSKHHDASEEILFCSNNSGHGNRP